ncbi:hypothetical protein K488DRAFT_75246 [Vararia minispora EC-137]|uniref:Uncharacterized protein n=1 Tax=Vararia minispora EC-137 TaxID=1314806 RepID=A0ACB8Q4K1_9AGAM|nr:hypothetical protein K488DRAFT_75246 [Vararia minispora EC-137]
MCNTYIGKLASKALSSGSSTQERLNSIDASRDAFTLSFRSGFPAVMYFGEASVHPAGGDRAGIGPTYEPYVVCCSTVRSEEDTLCIRCDESAIAPFDKPASTTLTCYISGRDDEDGHTYCDVISFTFAPAPLSNPDLAVACLAACGHFASARRILLTLSLHNVLSTCISWADSDAPEAQGHNSGTYATSSGALSRALSAIPAITTTVLNPLLEIRSRILAFYPALTLRFRLKPMFQSVLRKLPIQFPSTASGSAGSITIEIATRLTPSLLHKIISDEVIFVNLETLKKSENVYPQLKAAAIKLLYIFELSLKMSISPDETAAVYEHIREIGEELFIAAFPDITSLSPAQASAIEAFDEKVWWICVRMIPLAKQSKLKRFIHPKKHSTALAGFLNSLYFAGSSLCVEFFCLVIRGNNGKKSYLRRGDFPDWPRRRRRSSPRRGRASYTDID